MKRVSKVLRSTVAFAAFAGFGIGLTRATWGVSIIWPANGLVAGLMFDGKKTQWRGMAIAVAAGSLVANFWLVSDRSAALIFSLGNVIEVTVLSMSLRASRSPILAVPSPRSLYRFLSRAVLFPAAMSALAVGVATHFSLGWPGHTVASSWLFSDALGIAIFLPLGYICRRAWRALRLGMARNRRNAFSARACRNGLFAHGIVALVSVGSFGFAHWVPVYWALPSIVLAVLWAGSYAAVTGTFITAVVAVVCTVRAPLLSPLGVFVRPEDAILRVQGFTLACLLASYLMAAVLADRKRYLVQVSAGHRRQMELAERLRVANDELKALALEDALTGLANRRQFEAALGQAMHAAGAAETAVAVMFIDVDWFKRFNDRYGHERGDGALCAVANALVDDLPQHATAARIGGEEFAIVLPRADQVSAAQLAHSAVARVRALSMMHEDSPHGNVTISVGVALSDATTASDAAVLLSRADAAMYRAKQQGRNRFVVLVE